MLKASKKMAVAESDESLKLVFLSHGTVGVFVSETERRLLVSASPFPCFHSSWPIFD